jgi:large repetitive protein
MKLQLYFLKRYLLFTGILLMGITLQAQVGPTSIGTIPKNKTLKIVYDVNVNNPVSPVTTTQLSHQGTISGTNISPSVLTDDPDAAGTTDPTITLIDLPPYVVSINRQTPSAQLTNATSVVYRVTFSENVSGVDITDFSLNKTNTANATVASVSSPTGTTIDVTVNTVTGNGDIRLDLNTSGTGIVDDASQAITGGFSTGQTYTFDHTVPTLTSVTISSNNTNPSYAKVGDIITLGFTTSESAGTPTVTIATHSVTSTAIGNTYTATYTMLNTDVEGLVPFTIDFTDAAGNAGTRVITTTNSSSVTFDKTAPTLTINQASGQVDPTSATTIHFTVVFNEPVTGFATGDVSFTGSTVGGTLSGTITETAPNNGTTYDVAVTGMASPDGTVVTTITANKASDAAGNGNAASTSSDNTVNWIADAPPFVLSIIRQVPLNQKTNAASVTFRVVFSETVTGVDASDFTVTTVSGSTTAAVGTVTPVNGFTYDVAVNSISADGIIRLDLNNSGTGIKDVDGITLDDIVGGFTSGDTYIIDQTPPTLTSVNIASNNTNTAYAKVGDKVTVLITASELIQAPAITILGHSATVTNVSGNQWKGEYTTLGTDAPEGTIAFSIAFTDQAGNNGTAVSATSDASSVIFDKTLPTLTSVTIASDNTNPSYAKFNQQVTLSFTASEPITGTLVTIDGHTVTSNSAGGNSYTASIVMTNAEPETLVSFLIAGFKDAAGNTGAGVSTTTNSSSVTYDKTAPTLSPVTIISNNAYNTSLAKTGDVITLIFTSSETIQTPVVSIASHMVTATNTSGNTWSATYTVQSTDVEGNAAISIAFTDLAGNAGTTVINTTNSSDVNIDLTSPTLTTVSILSNNPNPALAKVGNIITVNITPSEQIQPPTATIAGHAATITPHGGSYSATYSMISSDAEGIIPFSISFTDLAGNPGTSVTTTTNSSTVTFDKTLPTISNVHIQSNNANTSRAKVGNIITLSWTTSEPVTETSVQIATHTVSAINTSGNNYSSTYSMTSSDAEGTISFSIAGFTDAAGNSGNNVITTTDGSSVIFDKTAPTVSPVTIASNNTNAAYAKIGDMVTLSFTASEVINTLVVTLASHLVTATLVTGNTYTATYIMQSTDVEGIIPFSLNFSDITGNAGTAVISTTNSSSVTFDKTAPAINVCPGNLSFSVGANCQTTTAWTVPTATDANVSGTLSAYFHSGPDQGVTGIGVYTETYKFKDPAGNESTCSFTVTVTDNTKPNFTTDLTVNPVMIWPPDHKMKDITLNYNVSDNCTTSPSITILVTSTDPTCCVSDGDKFPDWEFVDDHHIRLRAERGNGKTARVYTIQVIATDASGNSQTSQTATVTIAHNITAPITGTPFLVGNTVNFTGVFWDKAGNKHTAVWTIDDNTSVKGAVTEPSGTKNGKVTGSYKFTATGIYRLQMNITDQNKLTSYCNTNEDQEEIIVIYDPNGGYTYGGGYFNSPAGALSSDASATGKGNFGFTVNYYKGATLPKGETQFEFKVGDFQYNALNFEYLSVSGYKAVFTGSGKIIGGISGVSFTMYVIDGALDGTRVDKVRLKIYNKNTGYVYYDNEPGKSDAANPTTPVGINSTIVIGGTNATTTLRYSNGNATTAAAFLELKPYPNPSSNSFHLIISSSNSTETVLLKVTDILGREMEQRSLSPNTTITLGDQYRPGIYIVQAVQGKLRKEIKVTKMAD